MYIYNSLLNKIADINAQFLILEFDAPLLTEKNASSPYEKELLLEIQNKDFDVKRKPQSYLAKYYCPEYAKDDIDELFSCRFSLSGMTKVNGIIHLIDYKSKFLNIINHSRLTTDIDPNKKYEKTIYIFGNCIAFGDFVEDRMTVASQLQRIFNANNLPYKVQNCSNGGSFLATVNLIISNTYHFTKDDIIIVITQGLEEKKGFNLEAYNASLASFLDKSIFHYYNLSDLFTHPYPPDDAEIFFDKYHMNHRGYFLIAQKIFSIIQKDLSNSVNTQDYFPEQLLQYVEYLSFLKEKHPAKDGIIGAIVMNCNPFTLGHQYLIESALERCDFLYVFVLDEDKSFFKFDDRFLLAKINVNTYIKGYNKVCIAPSSKMIISNETFPEYFEKDKAFVSVDATKDLTIFGRYIAKKLQITKRFVGDEPYCAVTNKYNSEMKKVLLSYGVEVTELKRLAVDHDIISASKVRAAIERKDRSSVKKFVSQKTYDFLKKRGYL